MASVPTMPAAMVMTTTFARPPRRSRRVDGSGADETTPADWWVGETGGFEAMIAFVAAPRAWFLVGRRRENRAKTCTSVAPRHRMSPHRMRAAALHGYWIERWAWEALDPGPPTGFVPVDSTERTRLAPECHILITVRRRSASLLR